MKDSIGGGIYRMMLFQSYPHAQLVLPIEASCTVAHTVSHSDVEEWHYSFVV